MQIPQLLALRRMLIADVSVDLLVHAHDKVSFFLFRQAALGPRAPASHQEDDRTCRKPTPSADFLSRSAALRGGHPELLVPQGRQDRFDPGGGTADRDEE